MEFKENKRLFVSSFDINVTDFYLENYFSQYGEVVKCRISKLPDGISKQFAIIEMRHPSCINQILKDRHTLGGYKLKVALYNEDKWTYKARKVYFTQTPYWLKSYNLKKFFEKFGEVEKLSKEHNFVIYKDLKTAKEVINMKMVTVEGVKLWFSKPEKKINHKNKKTDNISNKVYEKRFLVDKNFYKKSFNQTEFFKEETGSFYIKKSLIDDDKYYQEEFFSPKKLKTYLRNIYKKNSNINLIPKEKIKSLELFYFNDIRRKKLGPNPGIISYYTMITRIAGKICKNHEEKNLRLNKGMDYRNMLELEFSTPVSR